MNMTFDGRMRPRSLELRGSATTPVTINQSVGPNFTRRPMGSSFGQSDAAALSLRIATFGAPGVSNAVKLRPRVSGTPIVLRNDGDTRPKFTRVKRAEPTRPP